MKKPGKQRVDADTKAKIISLFRDHDVTRTALVERFGFSFTVINDILRKAGVAK
jgi:hypothetical protein